MASTSDIKKGAVIRHNNGLYVITGAQFVNPGKGAAFTKTKMKEIGSGKSIEITYKSSETVDIVQVDHVTMQFLYKNGDFCSFMNQDTYETVDVDLDTVGDDVQYLKEGLEVIASTFEGRVVALQLPKKVTYKVVQAPPAVRGDSAGGNVTKEIVMDNGLKIQAPIFIKEGEEVVVNTETGEYSGRSTE